MTLNGTTPVRTVNSYLETHRMAVISAGSNERNAGTLTATSADTATVMAQISTGRGVTEQSHFLVPTGYTGLVIDEDIGVYRGAGGTGSRGGEFDVHFRAEFLAGLGTVTFETERAGLNNTGAGIEAKSPKLM